MTLAGLVDGERRVRLRAVREAAGPGLVFALRRLLFADDDAGVRAAAAGRLGELAVRHGDRAQIARGEPAGWHASGSRADRGWRRAAGGR